MPLYQTRDSYNYIGKEGLRRKDGYEKASGTGLYTRDISFPGMLIAKPFVCPYANAKIKSLDTSAVEAYPGVRYVLRYDDIWWSENNWQPGRPSYGWGAQWDDLIGQQGYFEGNRMGFAVVADNENICDEALRLAKIEWDVLPFYVDPEKALEPGATIIEPEVNPDTNMRIDTRESGSRDVKGDVQAGFDASDKVVEWVWSEEEESPAAAEPGVCVAVFRGEYLDIWAHNQVPINTQQFLQAYFGDWLKINVHGVYQGAQFGFANWIFPGGYKSFPMLAAICAQKTGKPVKFLFDQMYWHNRSYENGVYYLKCGFNMDGTINACQQLVISAAPEFNAKMFEGTKIPNFNGMHWCPHFNRAGNVCYRHGMRSVGLMNNFFAKVAAETGLDPTDIALLNDGCDGEDMDWVMENVKKPQGMPERDSLKEVITLGKQKFDWDAKYHAPGAKILPNGNYHGVGFTWCLAWSPDPNTYLSNFQGTVAIQRGDGHVRYLARHADGGWNHASSICQIIADELGAKYDDIEYRSFDDVGQDSAYGEGSAGFIRTSLIALEAARRAKQMLLERCCARGRLDCDPLFPGLTPDKLDTSESTIFEKANPDNKKTFREAESYQTTQYEAIVAPYTLTRHPWDIHYLTRQCSFIEIEVNPETGEIILKDICDVNDVGKIVSPETLHGQQYGGSVMGVSHNRNEAEVYDPATGVRLNTNLIDYKWFSFNDMPGPFSCNLIETGMSYGPYGLNGCSESLGATNSTILLSAFWNATGKWVSRFPLTPDKVLKALGKI
jgi:CO/xanthine dehydrogenase Mo-binding subunit